MGYIANGEELTSTEIDLVASLSSLAVSSATQAIQKTSSTTFANIELATGSGTVSSVSVTTANGVSGSVATATTTPAITLTLSAITPTSVAINGGTALTTSNQTGTGSIVLATSPTLVTPLLGTPTSGVLTNCTFPTLNQNTTGSAASVSISGQVGLLTFTGLAATSRIKTVRDAADTILELGGSYTPTGTWTSLTMVTPVLGTVASGVISACTSTSMVMVTPVLGTPTSGTLTNCTGLPVAGIAASTSTALGVGSLEIGHASDTTLARVSAGVASIEGNTIVVNTSSPTLATITTTGNIELGHASDTTLSRSAAGVLAVEGVVIPSISSTNTLTNKRVTRRAPTVTQSATPTINTDNTDVAHITGLAQAITSMTTNLSGTPVEGDLLRIDITDNGTARAITWGASFENSTVALPTTTVVSARLDIGFVWNTVTSKWRCIAVA